MLPNDERFDDTDREIHEALDGDTQIRDLVAALCNAACDEGRLGASLEASLVGLALVTLDAIEGGAARWAEALAGLEERLQERLTAHVDARARELVLEVAGLRACSEQDPWSDAA